jgi:hypothetical protein
MKTSTAKIGIDVVVAHERHHSSPGEFLYGGDRVGRIVSWNARRLCSTTSALPSATRLCSPLVNVAPMTHTMMSRSMVVRALVGPRPV